MVPPLPRLKGVERIIKQEQYFVIHAPRQSGKSTYGLALMEKLNREGHYTTLLSSIQPASSGTTPVEAMQIAALCIEQDSRLYLPEEEWAPAVSEFQPFPQDGLRSYLRTWSERCPKPIVLFLDEVDSLRDDNFIALLHQLRTGFVARSRNGFPISMGLIGLRDVRDYRIRLRPDRDSLGTGSPFNVKAESFFFNLFTQEEVNQLLDQHQQATGQCFPPEVKEEMFRLAQGQPWLINALANHIVSRLLDNDNTQPITLELLNQAREDIIQRRETHLDSLLDKLREPAVKKIVMAIINGEAPDFDEYNDAVLYTRNLGLIAVNPPVRLANPIYQEIIPRSLSFPFQESIPQDYVDPAWYIREGRLDMEALLKSFQKFYRRHSEAWLERYDFREVGRQLLLMAFLQRVINGGGRVEREMAVGNGRADMTVEYGSDLFVLELKLHRDQYSEEDGKEQLARYLTRLDQPQGYLLFFELDTTISWEQRIRWEQYKEDGKQITLVGM